MGIFGKRKRDEAFKIELEREAMDRMSQDFDGFVLPFDRFDTANDAQPIGINKKISAPHVLTAEELLGKTEKPQPAEIQPASYTKPVVPIPMKQEPDVESPSGFLYAKMTEARAQTTEQTTAKPTPPQPKTPSVSTESTPFDITTALEALKQDVGLAAEQSSVAPPVQTPPVETKSVQAPVSVPVDKPEASDPTTPVSPSAPVTQHAVPAPVHTPKQPEHTADAETRRTTLLARCNAYLKDDELGTAKIDTEKYKLESVDSILKDFETRASQRVMRVHGTTGIDAPTVKPSATKTGTPEKPVVPAASQNPSLTTDHPVQTTTIRSNTETPKATVKHYAIPKAPSLEKKPMQETAQFTTKVLPVVEHIPMEKDTSAPADDNTHIFSKTAQWQQKSMQAEIPFEPVKNTPDVAEQDTDPILDTDYKSVADRERVLQSLHRSKSRLGTRVWITVLLLIPSVVLSLPATFSASWLQSGILLPVHALLCVLGILVNLNIMKSLPSLFTSKPDMDLPSAIAAIATLLQCVVLYLLAGSSTVFPMSCVALLSLLFTNLGKIGIFKRILNNFNQIADSEQKYCVSPLRNAGVTKEIVGNSISGGSMICYGGKTSNIHDYLRYCYAADPIADRVQTISRVGLILGLGMGIATLILYSGDFAFAVTVFAVICGITAAPSALFVSNLPLKAAAGRLNCYGAMLSSYKAANQLDLCNGITVDCRSLFPDGNIRIVDMKLMSLNPIDQSLTDAAALADHIGSPIAGMFKQVNNTVSAHAPKVDSVVYEEKMGVSGWVDDRRVFIGNRILMEAHGFSNLPPAELDKKMLRKGYFPVYLASDNILCALFVVKYTADEEIAYELRRLCNTGTTVLVKNCDPNISAKMLCDYFGLYSETVAVMDKNGAEKFDMITAYQTNRSAGASYKHSVCGLFAVLTASIRVKRQVSLMSVLYCIGIVLGFALVALLLFTGRFNLVSALYLLAYQLVTTVIVCLPPKINRP